MLTNSYYKIVSQTCLEVKETSQQCQRLDHHQTAKGYFSNSISKVVQQLLEHSHQAISSNLQHWMMQVWPTFCRRSRYPPWICETCYKNIPTSMFCVTWYQRLIYLFSTSQQSFRLLVEKCQNAITIVLSNGNCQHHHVLITSK